MTNKILIFGAALTSCALAASAYAMRRKLRLQEAQDLNDDLRRWEGEGGKLVPPAPTAVQLR